MEHGVEVLWIARYDYETDWRVLPHRHGFFQLICSMEGSGTVTFEDTTICLRPEHLLLIPPGIGHTIAADQGEPVRTLDTKFCVLGQELTNALAALPQPTPDPENRVQHILERMRIEGMKRAPWYRVLCNTLLLEGLVLLIRGKTGEVKQGSEFQEPALEDPAITAAKEFIQDNYSRDIGVRDIASHVGYSPEYLSRRFGRATGVSPHVHLMRLRIEKAKYMLAYDGGTVKEVAFRTGFKSVHHFSRTFKYSEGLPPATWRDRELSGVWKDVVITPGFINNDLTVTDDG